MTRPKVVLVTGCAKGGIGYEYCKAFVEQNCIVFASDISQRMHEIVDLPSDKVKTLELDVTSDESVLAAINTIISKCGHIDILVNNAGIRTIGPLTELPLETIRKDWEINALGQLRLVQSVVPHMASQRSGCIVNVGSVVGKVATPWAGSYCGSKSSVHAFTNTLRLELKPFGIDVVLVMPGAVKSNIEKPNFQKALEWKVYKDFKDSIADRAKASQGTKATDAAVFARHVVKKLLSPKPPKHIEFGQMTTLFTLLSWSPLWITDWFFTTRFNLSKTKE